MALAGLLLLAGAASGASPPGNSSLNLSDIPGLAFQQALNNLPVWGFLANAYKAATQAPAAIDHLLFTTPAITNAPFMVLYWRSAVLFYALLPLAVALQGYRLLASDSASSRAGAKRSLALLLIAAVALVPLAPFLIQSLGVEFTNSMAGVLKPSGVSFASAAGLGIGGVLIGLFDPQSLVQILLANVIRVHVLFLLLAAYPLILLTLASGRGGLVLSYTILMISALLVPVANALALSVSFALMDSGAIDPTIGGPATYYLLLFIPGLLMGSSLVFSFWLSRAFPIPAAGPRLTRRIGEEGRTARRTLLRKRVRDDLRAKGLLGKRKPR